MRKEIKPIREYERLGKITERFVLQRFKEFVEPKIKVAMRKLGIKKVEDCNNCTFLDFEDGTSILDSEFNKKHQKFYDRYIKPLYELNGFSYFIPIKIKV